MTEGIVRLTALTNAPPGAHSYTEEKLVTLPDDMEIYVAYYFQCWCLALISESFRASLYIDKILKPVEYSIETLRINLNFNTF